MYISTSDVKQYGGIPATDTIDDKEIDALITRAQTFIESYTGRIFEPSTGARYYTASESVDGDVLWLDDDLNVFDSDLVVVAGSDTIPSSDMVSIPVNTKPYYGLRIKDGSDKVWDNPTSDGDYESAISVTGDWSYSSSAPGDIQHACIRLVKWFYKQGRITDETADRPIVLESGATVLPTRLPQDVIEILDYYRKHEVFS